MLIIGWHGKTRSSGFMLGSTVDVIIERAPCNVVILKDLGNRKFKRILVPLGGGPNGIFALEIASILAERDKAEIVAFTVNDRKNKIDIVQLHRMYRTRNHNRNHINFNRIKTKKVDAKNTIKAIIDESENYDLVVLGTTRDPWIYKITRDSVSHAVAQKCSKPMVIVKASGGIRSWIRRWL